MTPQLKQFVQTARKLCRFFPTLKTVQFGYEKDGLSVAGQPIPWNAESILVETVVAAPPRAQCKADYQLVIPGQGHARLVALCPETQDSIRLYFRLDPLPKTQTLKLFWRGRPLGQLELPHLGAEQFLSELRLESPTTFARLGGRHVACQAIVEGQGSGLMACGLLKSPTSLLPLVGLGLTLELVGPLADQVYRVPFSLAGPQVLPRQALLSTPIPDWTGTPGMWQLRWTVAGRPLAQTEVRVVPREEFWESLYIPKRCHVSQQGEGADLCLQAADHPAPFLLRFRIASRVTGLAAVCLLQVALRFKAANRPSRRAENEVLLTGVPDAGCTVEIPVDDYEEVEAFELSGAGRFLGSVASGPTPIASFTSEGGFRPPGDFPWTPAAEVALHEYLNRLLRVDPEGKLFTSLGCSQTA